MASSGFNLSELNVSEVDGMVCHLPAAGVALALSVFAVALPGHSQIVYEIWKTSFFLFFFPPCACGVLKVE